MSQPILALAHALQAQWIATLQALRVAHTARTSIHAAIVSAAGDLAGSALREWRSEVPTRKVFGDLRQILQFALDRQVKARGANTDVSLSQFDEFGDVPDDYIDELDQAQARSLVDIAERALKHYSPENAMALALREAADVVNRYFTPVHSDVPSKIVLTRGDRRVLTHWLSTDGYTDWELSWNGAEELAKVVRAIAQLLSQSERADAVHDHAVRVAVSTVSARRYSSRMRLPLGPGVQLVFFKKDVEYHFAPAALEALQLAIAEHGTDGLERAA
jgi:hypothetical protein